MAKIEFDVVADINEQSFNQAVTYARDTKAKLDPLTLLNYETDAAKLQIELDKVKKKLKKARADNNEALTLELTMETKRMQSNLTEAGRQLQNFKNTGDASLSRAQVKIDQVTAATSGLTAGIKSMFLGFASGTLIMQKLTQAISFSIDTFRSYETAFAGFRKTLNATESELVAIEEGIVSMSKVIPKSVEELSKIAELGGQMGLAADEILDFTRVVAQLSTSIDGISAEDAATTLARLQAQTGASIESLDRLGASLVGLGNNFKANEGEILSFANEVKSAGGIVGLTSQDILGISTAFVDAGINAEAGGTAVTKALLKIDDNVNQSGLLLGDFAKVSGKTKEQFVDDWNNDSANAFANVLEGISKEGDNANATIEKLFGSDIRLKKAMLAVSNAGGTLKDSIALANDEFLTGTALVDEFNKKLQTADSQIQLNENAWKAWTASFGEDMSKAGLGFKNLFLAVIPNAFATVSFGITLLGQKFQNGMSNIALFVSTGIHLVVGLFAGFTDVAKGVGRNFGILVDNMGVAFKNGLPQAIKVGANAAIKLLENFINKVGGGISGLLSQIPGLEGLDGLGNISLGRLNVETGGESLKDFEKITFKYAEAVGDNLDRVNKKFTEAKEKSNDYINTEALRLDEQRKLASTEVQAEKALSKLKEKIATESEEASVKQLNSIANLKTSLSDLEIELSNAEIGSDVFNALTEKIAEVSGQIEDATATTESSSSATSKNTEVIKENAKETEKLNKAKAQTKVVNTAVGNSTELVNDLIEDSKELINDYVDEISDLKDEIIDLDAELSELSGERAETLGERNIEILEREKEIKEEIAEINSETLTSDGLNERIALEKELKDLISEKALISQNATEAELEEAIRVSELSETAKFLEELEVKKQVLESEKQARLDRIAELEIEKAYEEQIYQGLIDNKKKIEQGFTAFLLKQGLEQGESMDLLTSKINKQIAALKRRNALLGVSNTSSGSTTNNSGDTVVNISNTINDSGDLSSATSEIQNAVIDAANGQNK